MKWQSILTVSQMKITGSNSKDIFRNELEKTTDIEQEFLEKCSWMRKRVDIIRNVLFNIIR